MEAWIEELQTLADEMREENDKAEYQEFLQTCADEEAFQNAKITEDRAMLAVKRLGELVEFMKSEVGPYIKSEFADRGYKLGVMGQCLEHLEQAEVMIYDAVMEASIYREEM